MKNKYELTDETKNLCGITLHRIRALRDIPSVNVGPGDLGGWIEKESNLTQYGDAMVCGDAEVINFQDYAVHKNSWSSGRWFTYNALADSELSGKCYEAIVRAQEAIDKVIEDAKEAK